MGSKIGRAEVVAGTRTGMYGGIIGLHFPLEVNGD